MTTVHPKRRLRVELPVYELTLDDVAELAAADEHGHRYELIDGNLLIMAPADADHMSVIADLVTWFRTNGYARGLVLPTPGIRINGRSSGRNPDVMVLRRPVSGGTVWIEPEDTILVVEVVSPSTRSEDRMRKPAEYAGAGIRHYWRIERDSGQATVHMFTLGIDKHGERAYLGHEAVLLDRLLEGAPPTLA
ncbi:Uma2 family endonuclease [Phytohabitans sp. ZYX-F-186]|uniref:Uma2 family endonuclease n=1 Tax=Phytohabitans maris TaxID=3071409 RepID=A0ABU0Z826_9ACTN|nr:Uma2 family endonuclease [Phytohabitans sp. ZYX-F-186]MDQ7903207.1 Uma2 family endonuclease [Phytohabitans sp. ZYX-F-186]